MSGSLPSLAELLTEYTRALDHTDRLWRDLTPDEIRWRPHADSSAIGWHLGHQPAVAHMMLRNLTAAEPSLDPAFERLMDSATPEPDRGDLPDLTRLVGFRADVAERVSDTVGRIERGEVGAPEQLSLVGRVLLVALIHHEYQHDVWIAEVRAEGLGRAVPEFPMSPVLTSLDGYPVLALD